jgi:hypothetical protein
LSFTLKIFPGRQAPWYIARTRAPTVGVGRRSFALVLVLSVFSLSSLSVSIERTLFVDDTESDGVDGWVCDCDVWFRFVVDEREG